MGKAQITIYLIAGILIVLAISLILYFTLRDRLSLVTPTPVDDIDKQVVVLIEDCLERSGVGAVSKLGKQGLITPTTYLASKDVKISYYYFKGDGLLPSRDELEEQLSSYIDNDIGACISRINSKGVAVEAKDVPRTDVIIEDSSVKLLLDYPVDIFIGGRSFERSQFYSTVRVDLGSMYEVTEQIYLDTMQNPEWISLERLESTPYKVRLIKIDDETLIYEITDSETGLEDKPYTYRFAMKYEIF